jgi:sterol desaturase/sphingolipid hydroxylase (fatty acid hydroxylase superfamily)
MESVVAYFEHIPSAHRSALLIGGLTLFLMLESAIPRFKWPYHKWHHLGINLFFTATTVLVNFLLATLLFFASAWVTESKFGLLHWLPSMNLVAKTLIGLLVLDLVGAWLVHWAEHKIRWMWRFHVVHHTDPHVDTSTANRHHPGESILRLAFTTLGVLVAGAPIYLVFLYQSLSAALSQFNHANIKFPSKLEAALGLLLVTPSMHRVHHHYRLPYTDRNFGNIFSIWDRIFGTYAFKPGNELTFGIDTHMDASEHSTIKNLLKIPFQPYRQPPGAKFNDTNSKG